MEEKAIRLLVILTLSQLLLLLLFINSILIQSSRATSASRLASAELAPKQIGLGFKYSLSWCIEVAPIAASSRLK